MALENLLRLDVRTLAKDGALQLGRASFISWESGSKIRMVAAEGSLRLEYTHNGRALDYAVTLSRTPCNYGGTRVWAICPALGCSHRVAVLYLYGSVFVCRHCTGHLYASQSESANWRDNSMSWKLRRRMGCDWGAHDIPAEWIRKPKGRHQKTHERMIARLEKVDRKALAAFAAGMAVLSRHARLLKEDLPDDQAWGTD